MRITLDPAGRAVSMAIIVALSASACTERSEPAPDKASTIPAEDTAHVLAAQTSDADSAVSVIRSYYEAIDERRFADAYSLWSDNGRASGKSLADFTSGFAETADEKLETGSPSRVEPAAGSRYITVPVTITATLTSGITQSFTGTYDLRRSVVDGATAEQRAWRIYSANIR